MSDAHPSGSDGPHYSRTALAFDKLIQAEIAAEFVIEMATALEDAVVRARAVGPITYVRNPDSTDDEGIRLRLSRRRSQATPEETHLWEHVDQYLAAERDFRPAVEAAKLAADAAAWELDCVSTPPLRRTAIAIKRALRNLSGSVPYSRTAWAEVTENKRVDAIAKALGRITLWIEELRLLVQPPHGMPPPCEQDSSKRHRQTTAKKRRTRKGRSVQTGPSALEVDVLVALDELGAHAEATRHAADLVAEKAVGERDAGRVKNAIARLGKRGMVKTREGRGGGAWVTAKGLSHLRRGGMKLAETRRTV